jgi:serine/threonine protein kinase
VEGSASEPTQLGRYQILKKLMSGGMAELLLARMTGMQSFERHVVIKRIHRVLAEDPRFVQMFLDEARVAASLHHQNIVQVYDVGEQDGEYFFAMEYVHGEDLRTLQATVRADDRQIPIAIVASIVTAAASGLHHAHEQRGPDREPLELVHRDVSLGNILVGYDGSVKLLDFGLARAALRSVKTRTGTLKGKSSYMSPEQCMGKPLDRRSDVFSLGIVLYELATGRRLFKAANEYLSMTAIVAGDIPPPSSHRPDLPRELDEIILRALAQSPDDRFPSADAMRHAIEQFAVNAGLRTSTKALADYVHQVFGDRPEPWRSDVPQPPPLPTPAESSASRDGVVEPPATPELIVTPADRRSAPIALAHAIVTGAHEVPDDLSDATVASPPPSFEADDLSMAPTAILRPLHALEDLPTNRRPAYDRLAPAPPVVTYAPVRPASSYPPPPPPSAWLALAQRYPLLAIAGAAACVLAFGLFVMLLRRC